MEHVNEPSWKDPEHQRRLEEAADRIHAMSDEELKALIAPVRDRPENEWTVEQLDAEVELDARLGVRPERTAEFEKHGGRSAAISIRMPRELLDRVREEARRRSTPYQRLIKDLVEAGLAASTQPVARVEISTDLLRRIVHERSILVEVRRGS